MKRVLTGVVATALVLSVGVTTVFAAGRGLGRNYVDANKDGLCDHYVAGVCPFRDADGDGVCDNCTGGGRYYVDANGDGVCDNYGSGGHGHGAGHGHCR